MTSISLRLNDEILESIDEEAKEKRVSRSEYIRDTLEARHESDVLRADLDELQTEYETLKTKYDELQRQLAAVNSRQDDVTELVEFVEEQRDLTRYQERRQRQLDKANILTRWKWKVTGVPVED